MGQSDLDQKLESLRLAIQRSSSNLVELEIDPSRQLLDASRLEGHSAERWREASAAIAELWRGQTLLEGLLERAERVRGARHHDQLRSLLEGTSIEVSNTTVPLSQRQLLETARATELCSVDQLLASMAASFETVKRAIAELTQPWEVLTPKLENARSVLEQARVLDQEVGGESSANLDQAAEVLQRITTQLAIDPMSVASREIEELERELQETHSELQELAGLRRGFEARMAEAHELLERLRTTVTTARTAHEELLLKVAVPSPPPLIEFDSGLEAELDAVAETGRHAAWADASNRLKAWTERAGSRLIEARQVLDASRAPIQARNQFRGLLDAYQVKARALGMLEDPELEDVFNRAQGILYTAPTDLVQAAQLVRSYQVALSNGESRRRSTV